MNEVNLYADYEKKQIDASRKNRTLPVTLITGYLGAGKTTLIQHVLTQKKNLHVATIVNDFGEINHDAEVFDTETDAPFGRSIPLSNGCMCCVRSLKSTFQSKVWSLIDQGEENRDFPDYLIIETSGVTDPSTIIDSLNERFGKLTRARLDSVVAIIDSDTVGNISSLSSESRQFTGSSTTVNKQLLPADVIILNKVDLISEQAKEQALTLLAKTFPSASIYCCSYGNVPIYCILDVLKPELIVGGSVSHESITECYCVSETGGNLRKSHSDRLSVLSTNSQSDAITHIEREQLMQVTYQSAKHMSLSMFQDWIISSLPKDLLRAKGMLAFTELPGDCFIFNLSGNHRFSIESKGQWDGIPRPYLIMIGHNLDSRKLKSELDSHKVELTPAVSGPYLPIPCDQQVIERCNDFEFFEGGDVVFFRFTGMEMYRLEPKQLKARHGVCLDAINKTILQAFNNSCGCAMTPATLCKEVSGYFRSADKRGDVGERFFVICWATNGRTKLLEVWPMFVRAALSVVAKELSYVQNCSCNI